LNKFVALYQPGQDIHHLSAAILCPKENLFFLLYLLPSLASHVDGTDGHCGDAVAALPRQLARQLRRHHDQRHHLGLIESNTDMP
jgi:hypothetical protein